MSDEPAAPEPRILDVIADELGLGRAQLDAGLPGLAEGTVRRRLERLEADGGDGAVAEMDALNLLLAEALWRQHRPAAARVALESIHAGSPQRRLPMAMLIEAEALSAAGEADRAAGVQERLLAAIGPDDIGVLRAGVPGRLQWPEPSELRPEPPRPARPPWSAREADHGAPDPGAAGSDEPAIARARLEDARVAYVGGDRAAGDGEMSLALRLDPGLAADGVAIIEPTLGSQPGAERLLLYGDLLRAAGRDDEARQAFERAAEIRG
jgi:tetratricopeptide (TPR) repeat protein